MKGAGWTFLLLLHFSSTLYALDATVAGSFKISGIERTGKKISFPLERQKYANIRVLSKDTYHWLSVCREPCVREEKVLPPVVAQVRPARTQENMWIATVDFLPSWRITCLVFKKGGIFSVKFPEHVEFLNDTLKSNTRGIILRSVQEESK